VTATFPSLRLSAFVAGETELRAGRKLLDEMVGEGVVVAELLPADRELLGRALLRIHAEADFWHVGCQRYSTALLTLGYEDSELEALEWATGEPLLLAYLEGSLNTNHELEELLVSVRKRLLLDGPEPQQLPLVAALAHQCFHNEYLYGLDEEERLKVAERCAALGKGPVEPREAVLLGMCRTPLAFLSLEQARRLAVATHPDPLEGVIARLIREPLEERELAAKIPTNTVTDPVSTAVRDQYEQNPFPRWYRLRRGGGGTVKQPRHDAGLPAKPRILVAGCGTGQQPVSVARRFPEARIVALDLSVASLAYGKRQARQLDCGKIEWVHGDLLDVARLDEQFDLIFCSGVLHHLGDEVRQAGWNALVGVLVPGGLIRIHVYSVVARMIIATVRDEVARRGLRPVPEDMLRYRAELIARVRAGSAGYAQLAHCTDFFTMSNFRDLLFHAQEHHYRIAELVESAAEAGLEFVGFELPERLAKRYREQFPDDPEQVSLANWRRFEVQYAGSISLLDSMWRKKEPK
jgi:SAM-dependent methyltransferase